jgi:hypothetical protein
MQTVRTEFNPPDILQSNARKVTCWSFKYVVEPTYNNIVVYDTSPIVSDILWYQLIPHRQG